MKDEKTGYDDTSMEKFVLSIFGFLAAALLAVFLLVQWVMS